MMKSKKYKTDKVHSFMEAATKVMFTQMNAYKGIKMFGERAISALIKEYKQLNDKKVMGRTYPSKLLELQKRRALQVINTIKKKRCGKIKGRSVANRSVQRKYVPREEATSPTVSQ